MACCSEILGGLCGDDAHPPPLPFPPPQDILCPPALIKRAAEKCGAMCELAVVESAKDHFGMYSGQAFEDTMRVVIPFLKRHAAGETTLSIPSPHAAVEQASFPSPEAGEGAGDLPLP